MARKKKPSMLKTQRQKLAAQRAKRAASQQKARAGMTNLKKPTMQKLVRKAAQSRKRASGRPLVRKAELDKAKKPSIKRGASALRGRANAPKNLANMTKKLAKARGLRRAGRGGLATLALMAANKIQDRLLSPEALKRKRATEIKPLTKADLPSLPKGGGSRRGQGSGKPATKRGKKPVANLPKDYKKTEKAAFDKAKKPQSKKPAKLSAGAKAFDKAFAAARSAGKKEFTWRGKRYHTRLKK
jgi:hypothetical protein